ncbi:MAG: hypothetical protein KDC57_23960, partial [Saprospiraceae bacterium]|nr:hypothetical protein [Saprospiraceae bacterium]
QLTWNLQVESLTAVPIGKYYSWNTYLFSDEQLNYQEDFKFITKPTSHAFELMETSQILFQNKHGNLIHFYEELRIQASEIIQLINKELN